MVCSWAMIYTNLIIYTLFPIEIAQSVIKLKKKWFHSFHLTWILCTWPHVQNDSSNSHTCRAHTTPEGYLPWKGLWDCVVGKTPFSHSISCSTRPPFQHFSVPQDLQFNLKSHYFPFFHLIYLILTNFQFLILKMGKIKFRKPKSLCQKSILKAALCQKTISSTSLQIWRRSILQAPIFQPFGPLTPTLTKVSTPWAYNTRPLWQVGVAVSRGRNKAGPQANCPQNLVRTLTRLRSRAQMALENVSSLLYLMYLEILQKHIWPWKNLRALIF